MFHLPFINAASFLSDLVRCIVVFIVEAISKLHHLVDLLVIGIHSLVKFFILLDEFLHSFNCGLLKTKKNSVFKIVSYLVLSNNDSKEDDDNDDDNDDRGYGNVKTDDDTGEENNVSLVNNVKLTPFSSLDRNSSCWPRMASHCLESRINNCRKEKIPHCQVHTCTRNQKNILIFFHRVFSDHFQGCYLRKNSPKEPKRREVRSPTCRSVRCCRKKLMAPRAFSRGPRLLGS